MKKKKNKQQQEKEEEEMEEVDYLAHERSKAQFDVEAMKIVWAGSRHNYEVADRMSRLVASDPVSIFFFFFFFLI